MTGIITQFHCSPPDLDENEPLTYDSYYNRDMNSVSDISTLGYALLGLIQMQPATGYQLRKVFQETPMAQFSSSPGAIYPALKGLAEKGLARVKKGVGQTGRATEEYAITARGRSVLEAWLRQPVTKDDVDRRIDITLLRFSYLDLVNDRSWSRRFLEQFRTACDASLTRIQEIQRQLAPFQPQHGKFALQNGIAVMRAHRSWADQTLSRLNDKGKET